MYADLKDARIFFDTVGSHLAIDGERIVERPTLIVMHGGPGFDHSSLRPYFDRFADTHQVIYLDHRGNGRSSGAPDSWYLSQWGDDVKAFCDALGIVKPVVYGNSFGGMVAMAYAGRHPAHPSKLILSSTAAQLNLATTFAMMQQRGGGEARAIAEKFWGAPDEESMLAYMNVCMPLYNPRPSPALMAARKRAIHRPEVARHFILGEMRHMDTLAELARVTCPTLVMAGGYDPITPVVCSEEIMRALPGGVGELVVFEAAGHGIHRDEPERAEEVLRRFLSQEAQA